MTHVDESCRNASPSTKQQGDNGNVESTSASGSAISVAQVSVSEGTSADQVVGEITTGINNAGMEVLSLDVAAYDENGRVWGPNIGLIVGCVIGGLVLCVIIIVIVYCCIKKRKEQEMQQVAEQSQDFTHVKY